MAGVLLRSAHHLSGDIDKTGFLGSMWMLDRSQIDLGYEITVALSCNE